MESKKIKGGNGGEYAAMREAIGQVMTGCPKDEIPVVAVPHNEKTEKLADAWLNDGNGRLRAMGIRIALVPWEGKVEIKT